MTRSMKRRLDKLERGGPAEMPAELHGVLDAHLALPRERAGLARMSDEQRAVREAPGFADRVKAALEWGRRHPTPEAGRGVAAALARRRLRPA